MYVPDSLGVIPLAGDIKPLVKYIGTIVWSILNTNPSGIWTDYKGVGQWAADIIDIDLNIQIHCTVTLYFFSFFFA